MLVFIFKLHRCDDIIRGGSRRVAKFLSESKIFNKKSKWIKMLFCKNFATLFRSASWYSYNELHPFVDLLLVVEYSETVKGLKNPTYPESLWLKIVRKTVSLISESSPYPATPNLDSRALFFLNGGAAKRELTENEGRKTDTSGADNTKSVEDRQIFKKARKN